MKRQNTVLILCLLLNIAQYNLWQYIQHNFFYISESVQYLLIGTVMYNMAAFIQKNIESKQGKRHVFYIKLTVTLWIIFAVNDLCDLLFFDPKKFGWNEVAFCSLAFIITIVKINKQWKTNISHL